VTIISRRDAESGAVVMSLDSYDSIVETLHLTSNPANAAAMSSKKGLLMALCQLLNVK